MVSALLVCLLGATVIFGYSAHDRRSYVNNGQAGNVVRDGSGYGGQRQLPIGSKVDDFDAHRPNDGHEHPGSDMDGSKHGHGNEDDHKHGDNKDDDYHKHDDDDHKHDDHKHDDHKHDEHKYDEHKYDEHKYDEHKYDEHKYDEHKYDEHKYDEHKYDEHKHDEHKHDDHKHDDHKHDDHKHDDHKHDDHKHDDHKHDDHKHDDHKHDDDDHKHDYVDGRKPDDDHDNGPESQQICLEFKDVVLKQLIGFPKLDKMAENINVYPAFMPMIRKGVSTFKLTYDAEMATKQMMVDFSEQFVNLMEHCPSTIFSRILLYAASNVYDSILLQEKEVFGEIVDVLGKYTVTEEKVRYFGGLMFGVLVNDAALDIAPMLFGEYNNYLHGVFPIIQKVLVHGGRATQIDAAMRKAASRTGMTTHCIDGKTLVELYRVLWKDLDTRYTNDNFDTILGVLPLSELPVDVKKEVFEKSKVLLRRGVQMLKNILTGLRDERLGHLESDAQRLLNGTELDVLKKVVKILDWKDSFNNATVTMPAEKVVHIMVKEAMKDLPLLAQLISIVNNISANISAANNETLSASLSLLSVKLNALMKRKCSIYNEHLSAYGPPIHDCKR